MAHAFTRAYLTNGTGLTVYGLHVKLKNPALVGSLGSGLTYKMFQNAALSPDGTELIFSNPANPLGIQNGDSVWIGWQDADPGLPADAYDYWWTDLNGDMVGGVQIFDPATDTGDPSLLLGLDGTGGTGGTGGGGGGGGGLGPPSGPLATPELGTLSTIFSGLGLVGLGLARRRVARNR